MITKLRKFLEFDPNTDIKFDHENDRIFVYPDRTREVVEAMVECVEALGDEKFLRERGCDLSPSDWALIHDDTKAKTESALANLRAKLEES